ncbi:MAG: MBOAT family O-acyltransferase, partial [Stellaceae bacterium]
LRDYLYIPLGGNRKGEARTYTNLMLTMAIGGLWHGASWSFLLWGVVHGVALAVARWWSSYGPRVSILVTYPLTLAVVLFSWTPFRATTWDGTVAMLAGQIGLNGIGLSDQIAVVLRPVEVTWLAIGTLVVIWPAIQARFLPRLSLPEWWSALWPSLVFLYAIAVMMGHQTVPFLYFQF